MKTHVFSVAPDVLERADEAYSAMTLSHPRPIAKLFAWQGKMWTCIGGTSSGAEGLLEVNLHEVVPEALYDGPPHNPKGGPDRYYVGLRFRCNKQVWVMTGHEICLVPDKNASVPKPEQLTLF